MPIATCKEYKIKESEASKTGVTYKVANGAKVPDLGERQVDYRTVNGLDTKMSCCVADVHKILLSVAKIVDEQNIVQFGPRQQDNFMYNIKNKIKTPIKRENNTFVIELDVLDPKSDQKSLGAVELDEAPKKEKSSNKGQVKP